MIFFISSCMTGNRRKCKIKQELFLKLIISDLQIRIEEDGADTYTESASQILGLDCENISILKILSKSLDIKDETQFYYKLSLVVNVPDCFENLQSLPLFEEPVIPDKKIKAFKDRPIVIGFGPAGIFAALELIDHGFMPVIFDRGKKIEERAIDVQRFIETRELNTESNIQFGEGGAGSFSDGKLFSRRNSNTGHVNHVLKTFIKFGAPHEIEYMSKPHLGTDVLCKIVRNIRQYILEKGGDIYYSSKMTGILVSGCKASGVVINNEKEYFSSNIFIALGHSARDTFEMLYKRNVAMEQRPISVGVRIEHPVETVNLMRYGKKYCNYHGLGAATYSLNYTNPIKRRGVYTFCMCPGGEVINASSHDGMMVLNGMSYSHRDSAFSNAALAVTCHSEDYKSACPLAGIGFQTDIEQKAFKAGGGTWHVPAQNLLNFSGESQANELNETSFRMGAVPCDLKEVLPEFAVTELLAAFHEWKKQVPLFISEKAVLFAPETRTSSPVRILRNKNFMSLNMENLIPIGEGSGYTGGITSSAADAIKAVEARMLEG
jgi:uncharacterized FAD-dependent dehydrogenase